MTLTGDTLTKYNRVAGGVPPTPLLGDVLNAGGGNPDYVNPGTTVSLYVETTGDDTTGDGSQASPFRQPQTALDQIPRNVVEGTRFEIFCGAGEFEHPYFDNVPPQATVIIWANLDNPVVANASPPSFGLVAGREALRESSSFGAHAGLADGEAWLRVDNSGFGADSIDYGFTVPASSSPDIRAVSWFDVGYAPVTVYPYETVFTIPIGNPVFRASGRYAQTLGDGVVLFGISLQFTSGDATGASPVWDGVILEGCKFTRNGVINPSPKIKNVKALDGLYAEDGVSVTYEDCVNVNGAYHQERVICTKAVDIDSMVVNQTSGVADFISVGSTNDFGFLRCAAIDFSGGGRDCLSVAAGDVTLVGDIAVVDNPESFLVSQVNTPGLRNFVVNGSRTVTGTTTGNCVELVNGAQAIRIKSACDGNLASSGADEIVVGGNAGADFSTLPATDVGAGSPQLCRAT